MKVTRVLEDLALSAVGGYVATKAMDPVSMKLYEWESVGARAREDAVRPGPPYRIAAEKLSRLVAVDLDEKRLDQVSLAFHYGLALQWAPLYPLLRRRTGLGPVTAGLTTGGAMSLIADELMTPAFGFSAPNLEYPLVTHVRGVVAHLVFGLALAATVETAWAVLRQPPSVTRRAAYDARSLNEQ